MWAGILLIMALGLTYLLEAPEELEEATYLGLLFLVTLVGQSWRQPGRRF